MAIKTFADVQALLTNFVNSNGIDIGGAPHGSFWDTSYNNFVNGNVPNVVDPDTNDPLPVLTKGDGEHSNIIYALRGTPGTLWDPNSTNPNAFGRMPQPNGPWMPDDQIDDLCDWITNGCPQ